MTAQALTGLVADRDTNLAFIEELQAEVRQAGRDLNDTEREQIQRRQGIITNLNGQIEVERSILQQRIDADAQRQDLAKLISEHTRNGDTAKPVEYRSAAEYVCDRNRAFRGDAAARMRVNAFQARAVEHQTTADNPGLLPQPLVGPVINAIDAIRPVVTAFGVLPLDALTESRPHVTQHTKVDKQTAEKTELASRKMKIERLPITGDTYGGYLNVSIQDQAFTQPNIMDIVIADLGDEYAIETEEAGCAALVAAATAAGASTTLPANPTAANVAGSLWAAAGVVYAAVKGRGRLVLAVSPDMLGLIGPLFAPVNPQNAQSTGFSAGAFGQGAMGAISQISVVMSAGLGTGSLVVSSTAAMEFREHRYGVLQVTEPSVLGTQVAVAGTFAATKMLDGGIQLLKTT